MKANLLVLVIFVVGCKPHDREDPFSKLTLKERIELSKSYYEEASHYGQGGKKYFVYLDSAILANPENGIAYKEKSVWYFKTGQHLKGMELLNKAVELDSLELGYRGWLKLYWLRDFTGAIEDLTAYDNLTSTTDYPMGDNLYFTRGLAKKQLGDFENALNDFNKCIEIDGARGENLINHYVFLYKGITLFQMNRTEEALFSFNKVLESYAKCPEALYYKGMVLEYLGQKLEARENFLESYKYGQSDYLQRDPYIELFDQLYLSDIEEKLRD
ncbi:MAG: hypothetical protein H0V01_10305 [Bacteroidetes bacterium]|nr:hypothetical protein [Bacteroidota bacterium]HET6246052.1 tetratricopeptide repeat protein [Bacteroidia bacterium]